MALTTGLEPAYFHIRSVVFIQLNYVRIYSTVDKPRPKPCGKDRNGIYGFYNMKWFRV